MNKQYCPYCMTPVPEGESCSVCGLTAGVYVPSPHHLPPGTVLMDRYLVGRVLGEGGFGITYIGRDLRLELKVAIKEYYPMDRATRNAAASLEVSSFVGSSSISFDRGKKKFLGEAQVMARLDKQQVIVSVRDFFEINNTAYIVMEYVEGITLRELVEQKGGKIAPEELFPLLEPLFHALSIMHENGLIHRDISPDNLMLENGKIRLLDFGCAREASRGTETMTIALKHGYAPIEQYQQKGQGPWTDIYALSATIYYCLTGKVPPQALDRITEDELLLPGKLGVEITVAQEKALLKGMRIQPNRRYATAKELWAALYTQQAQPQEPWDDKDFRRKNPQAEAASNNAAAEGAGSHSGGIPSAEGGTRPERESVPDDKVGSEREAASDDKMGSEREAASDDKMGPERESTSEGGTSLEREKLPGEESRRRGKIGAQDRNWTLFGRAVPRRFALTGLGILGCCLVIGVSIALLSGGERPINPEPSQPSIFGSEEADQQSSQSAEEPQQDQSGEDTLPVFDNFDDAYVFSGGSQEELKELLEDSSVTAIVISSDAPGTEISWPGDELVINKPVLLEKNVVWSLSRLTIQDQGYLKVEGTLDMDSLSYLRLKKGGLRLNVGEGGIFRSEGFVWMDEESSLSGEGETSVKGNRFVFSEEIFEGEDAVSVNDYISLAEAADRGDVIRIEGDITLEGYVGFRSPIRISEGVTVKGLPDSENGGCFYLSGNAKGGVLVNYGTLENLWAENNVVTVNYGLLEGKGKDPEEVSGASLWYEGGSVLLNLGQLEADNCSRFLDSSLCVNLGSIIAYNFCLSGGNLANYGTVDVKHMEQRNDEGWMDIDSGSHFGNYGSLQVNSRAGFFNWSKVTNLGEVLICENGSYQNTLTENHGIFRGEEGAVISSDGIFYGNGEYQVEGDGWKSYFTGYHGIPEDGRYVGSPEELMAALEDPQVRDVVVAADLNAAESLTLRKNLYISEGCSLTLSEGAELTGYGGWILLGENTALRGGSISLYEDSQIFLAENAVLETAEKGRLTLDESLLWGWGGTVRINGAAMVLKNRGGFVFPKLDAFEAQDGEILLEQGAVFVTPYADSFQLRSASITLSEGYDGTVFCVANPAQLDSCAINIGAGGFRNTSGSLTFSNCQVTVGEKGTLSNQGVRAQISFLSGASLENRGKVEIFGWTEMLVKIHGTVDNYGDMYMCVPVSTSQPIHNEGNYFYSKDAEEEARWRHGLPSVSSFIQGNAPIEME